MQEKTPRHKPKNYFNRQVMPPSWDPFEEMDWMQEEMNQMFQESFDRAGTKRGVFSSNMSFNYDFDL